MTYLRKRRNAFVYAFRGLAASIRKEAHMRIHLGATFLVITIGVYFKIQAWEWMAVLACIVLVLVAELFNTVAERLCDLISTEQNPDIGYIKDISAAAVLLACLFAVVTGLIVFVPYFAG